MSELLRIALVADFRGRIRALLPGVTAAHLAEFEAMVTDDRVVGDDGRSHPDLVVWVRRVLRGGDGAAGPVAAAPVPNTGPAGAEVAA